MDLRSDLPEPFLRTVRTAMELDPHKRFASAGQLAEGLAECLGSGFAPPAPAYAPAYTPTYAPSPTPAYTPTYPPAYAPVPTPGRTPPPPMPAPPPPKPLVEPAAWANLFGLLRSRRLSKRGKWVLIGLTIFAVQKWWRDDTPDKSKHKATISAPATPASSDDDPDNSDDDYVKAESLLQRPYKESNVAAAVKGFQKILDQNPKSALAEAGLGSAYFTQYNTSHDPKLLALAKSFTSKAIEMDCAASALCDRSANVGQGRPDSPGHAAGTERPSASTRAAPRPTARSRRSTGPGPHRRRDYLRCRRPSTSPPRTRPPSGS